MTNWGKRMKTTPFGASHYKGGPPSPILGPIETFISWYAAFFCKDRTYWQFLMAPRLHLSRSLLRWKSVLPSQIIEHIVTEVFNSYHGWNAFCNWYPFLPSSFIMLVGFVGGILTRHPTDSVSLLSRSPSFTVIIWATCLVRRLKLLNQKIKDNYEWIKRLVVIYKVFSCWSDRSLSRFLVLNTWVWFRYNVIKVAVDPLVGSRVDPQLL